MLAFCGLLLAGVVGTAVYFVGLRTTGQRLSQAFQGLFAKSHGESDPRASIGASDSEKSQARDLYLKGRYEWNQRTPDSLNSALDYFTQAIVHDPGYAQYCSLNYPDGLSDVDWGKRLDVPRTKREVAHLALDAAGIAPVAAGDDAFLKDLVEDRFMKGPPLPRGE